jgi:hypothetical protein
MLEEPVTPEIPAFYLQARSSVSIIADALACPQRVTGEIRAV